MLEKLKAEERKLSFQSLKKVIKNIQSNDHKLS